MEPSRKLTHQNSTNLRRNLTAQRAAQLTNSNSGEDQKREREMVAKGRESAGGRRPAEQRRAAGATLGEE